MKQQTSIKEKALAWANKFDVCCYLDSNNYPDPYSKFDCLVAIGARKELKAEAGNAFEQLKHFYNQQSNWMFGILGYDLKNEIEDLSTPQSDSLDFPDLYFFVPEYLIAITGDNISCLMGNQSCIDEILNTTLVISSSNDIKIKNRIDKPTYTDTVNKLKEHIKRGDIYEINFCQEFYAENAIINPLAVYTELNALSPTPFSGFFKLRDKYILSATPERFIAKRGQKLVSQPIKGTAKRSKDLLEDESVKKNLRDSVKEQAENVMIVDLVRNDLTKSAVKGSVKVDELFGIYSFPQVHQMISTISSELNPNVHFIDAIKDAFPMGSMTGAPKFSAMKLIDQYEMSKRGAYSGSFGVITPDGDFDFNVIIRSILYNQTKKYLSFLVGGAITYQSDAENEYEECLLKASAMMQVLNKKG